MNSKGAVSIIKTKNEKLHIKGIIVITPRINPRIPDNINNFFRKILFDNIVSPLNCNNLIKS